MVNSCSDLQQKVILEKSIVDHDQITIYRNRIKVLSEKVQRTKDTNDIKRLQRIYGYYFDKGLWEDITELFTENATLEYARDGIYKGKHRIREYFYTLGRGRLGLSQGHLNEHFQLMPVITLAEDGLSAKGRWRDLSLQGKFGEIALWGEGPYENEYVKEGGVWKISKLQWFQTVLVPYKGGWAEHEDFNKGIYVSDSLPPDSPPTTNYGYWPETFLPPFHFQNPVGTYESHVVGKRR